MVYVFLWNSMFFGFYSRSKADKRKLVRCGDDDLDKSVTDDTFLQSDELLFDHSKRKIRKKFILPSSESI